MHRSLWALSGERIKDSCFGPSSKVSRRCGVQHSPSLADCSTQPQFLVAKFQHRHLQSKSSWGSLSADLWKPRWISKPNILPHLYTRETLSGQTWQTFPSFRQVMASSNCCSSPTPGPAGPISDGNGCRSRILSAHSRLTSNQLGLMNDGNATGSTAMTKNAPISAPHLTVLFTLLSSHFHQLLKNSTHHIGSAADAEAKNETCVAGHRCSTWEFVQLAQSFLSGHHLTWLWLYHWVIHKDKTYVWLNASCFSGEHKQRYIVD